jgi:mono/diheme cytochrome c family protein
MIKHNLIVLFLLFTAVTQVNAADSDDVAAGKDIYDNNCSDLCHQAPAADRLRPKQWRVVLNTMQIRMQSVGMDPLTDVELEQILAYLTQGR